MLDVRYSTKFKKDFKLCAKRGLDISLFQKAINTYLRQQATTVLLPFLTFLRLHLFFIVTK